ncbi:MAG: extracellular elastinolytic metalloproteinase [Flavobacteriaceae bacterium]|jgi:extracellular elastinolytic metalloproteinase
MITKIIRVFCFLCCFLLTISIHSQEELKVIDKQISSLFQSNNNKQNIGWEITSEHVSRISNVHHIYFSQIINGLIVENTESSIHIKSSGELINESNRFINLDSKKTLKKPSNSLSAIEAVKYAAHQLNYKINIPLEIIEKEKGINKQTKISNGGFTLTDIIAKLKYLLDENDELVLVWDLSVFEKSFEHNWNIFVDANSGKILKKVDNLFNCIGPDDIINHNVLNKSDSKIDYTVKNDNEFIDCENCYEVFSYPLESPYFGDRTIVINPANLIASPFGWHDTNEFPGAESNSTTGNNISAFIYDNGYQPNGGELLNFTEYPFDPNYSEENNSKDASIANVFYWSNLVHDVLYMYGFDEKSGNFQQNNYGNGGLDDDYINIFSQDDFNCNAGISMFPDGFNPFVKMGICGNKDSGVDNLVIVHEYAHGYSYRLLGGAASSNCFTGREAISESYSDWLGLLFTLNSSSLGTTPRGYATYFFNQGPNGNGVRPYPYSTDMDINPYIYQFFLDDDSSTHWTWGSILWEITWALIDANGIDENLNNVTGDINQDAGNIMALAIVTESLKLLGCAPTMLEARNAILTANRLIYGKENECILWKAFAKRGMGIAATEGISSFETISTIASLNISQYIVCANSELLTLGGGTPIGGSYSGIGVIDDGNGETFSFNAENAGIGIHTITYEVIDGLCTTASNSIDSVEVILDVIAPEVICSENLTVTIPQNEDYYQLIDFSSVTTILENCDLEVIINQQPNQGTLVGVGNTIINFEVTDLAGNNSNCSFILTVEKKVVEGNAVIEIYPNPTNGKIIISSSINIESLTVQVFDINGRLVYDKFYNEFGFENLFSLESLSSGLYFIKIISKETSLIQRIIKN